LVTRHLQGTLPEEIDATVKSMIEAAKAECDVVVVSMHWEREDDTTVTEGQEAWVQQMVDWGADIIVGTGPHVVQKIEYRNAADGSKALVLYSLGNFISAQSSPYNLVTGIADIEIEKNNESGEISINSVDIIPVVTQYSSGYSDLHLVKLQDFNSELEAKNGAGLTNSYARELLESVIGKEYISSLRSGE
ncbi:MAG: CapA family protein, partial [Oscillospiraceae bacterium]